MQNDTTVEAISRRESEMEFMMMPNVGMEALWEGRCLMGRLRTHGRSTWNGGGLSKLKTLGKSQAPRKISERTNLFQSRWETMDLPVLKKNATAVQSALCQDQIKYHHTKFICSEQLDFTNECNKYFKLC